jgi:hypothetical protein
MQRAWTVAAIVAVCGCTSVRMVERDGCWLKQTEKWPSRVSEELAFCKKAAPAPAQDSLARLVQECVAQADYRWENRAIDAWNRDQPIPPRDSDEKIAATCMSEAAAALGPESERMALKARLAEIDKDREALRNVTENDRAFFQKSNDKMSEALGEAAKKPAPAATATATSTGTAKTESDVRSAHEAAQAMPPTTVVGFNAPPPATPVIVAPSPTPVAAPAKPSSPCAPQRRTADKATAGTKPAEPAPNCEKAVANAPAPPRAG